MKRRNEFYPALCLALAALMLMLAMLACDGTGDVSNRKKAAHWTPCYDGLTPLVTTDGREWCPEK